MNYWKVIISMNLTSLTFLFFCVITIIIYFIVPKKIQWVILLISSIIFLFCKNFNINTIIQAIVVLFTSYFIGLLIYKNRNSKKSKKFLILGIILILAQLVYLKYINLFIITTNHILSFINSQYEIEMTSSNSLIGISYYSLIMISYLIDIYRGSCKPQKSIFKCALFMSYFPILTSGPFIKYDQMENQLYSKHKFNYHNMCSGLIRIFWGLFKILVISLRIGYFVDTVYSNINNYNGFYIVVAVLLFPLQLYTNFSGSIDIILGISEIIGISLPENFKTPFFSKTITEFWRKWHITLGAWLRDYVFYPLLKSNYMQSLNKTISNHFGKNIGKKTYLYLSMLIMWIIIGIWHGGAYTYIIGSGLLQFVFMFFEDLFEPIATKINSKLGIKTDVFSYKLYQVIRTYLLFSFSMIFFRATSISNAIDIIKNIFVYNLWILLDNESLYTAGLDMLDFRVLIISLLVLFMVERLSCNGSVREKLFNQNIIFRWGIIYLLVFSVIIFGCYGVGYDPAEFIYGQV